MSDTDPIAAAEAKLAAVRKANQQAELQVQQELEKARAEAAEKARKDAEALRQQRENDRAEILASKEAIDNFAQSFVALLARGGENPQLQAVLGTLQGARTDLKKQAVAHNASKPVDLTEIKKVLAGVGGTLANHEKRLKQIEGELPEIRQFANTAKQNIKTAQADAAKARELANAALEKVNQLEATSKDIKPKTAQKLAKPSKLAWVLSSLTALVVLVCGTVGLKAYIVSVTQTAPLAGLSAFLLATLLAAGAFMLVLTVIRKVDSQSPQSPPVQRQSATPVTAPSQKPHLVPNPDNTATKENPIVKDEKAA